MSQSFCPACLHPLPQLSVCPQCGWFRGMHSDALYLPPGTVITPPYQVARVLGHGGFGITYLGWDANLQIKVAIKEYMPREFARRDSSGQLSANSDAADVQFCAGLTRFLDEARTLAKFQQHPGIVSVLSFFPAFGTGYMVMEYVEGETLKSYLDRQGRLNWTQTLDIFMQIMDALRTVHKAGLLHRDIAPDNIYLCGDGRVKLLDFGAAQTSLAGQQQQARSQAVMVKSGFAPEEQYQEDSQQGPWTDVYSLAASMYFCLTGQAPPDALDRLKHDLLKPPSDYGVTIPLELEQVLLGALAVRSLNRPQSIESLQNQFIELQRKPVSAQQPKVTFINQAQAKPLLSLPAESSQSNGSHWQRWLLIGGIGLFLVFMLLGRGERKQAANQVESVPKDVLLPAGPSQPDLNDQTEGQEWIQLKIRERQAAEQLKQQQEAALKRFEERRRQEMATTSSPSIKQTDPQQLEHLRSLCAEWSATMECQELRKSQ